MKALLAVTAASGMLCLGASTRGQAAPDPLRALVLGIAQDGGVPHIGCAQAPCVRARRDPARRQRVAALGLVDEVAGQRFLVDATPDLPSQIDDLNRGRTLSDRRRPVDGILLTHAHMGHYTGLMWLGREALGARAVPVYATPRLAAYLRTNGPWSQLVALRQIDLREVEPGREVALTRALAATPIRVPHRDELSDTVGWRIRGPARTILYVPDIDKWERWDRRLEDEVASVDIALLDGTFLAADEVPGRSLEEIPHPLVGETTARLGPLAHRVVFVHLNHTNALLHDPAERRRLEASGARVAFDGQVFPLGARGH